jgi:hypothetical protein
VQAFANALEQTNGHRGGAQFLPGNLQGAPFATIAMGTTNSSLEPSTLNMPHPADLPQFPLNGPQMGVRQSPSYLLSQKKMRRFAFQQGLLFGGWTMMIFSVIIGIITILTNMHNITIEEAGSGVTGFSILLFFVLPFIYFFGSMRVTRQTLKIKAGLLTSLWITCWLAIVSAISTIVIDLTFRRSLGELSIEVASILFIVAMEGLLGLGISALGGLFGRKQARKVYIKRQQG